LECVNALNLLGLTAFINLRWIKGHDGCPGNERADALARQGAALGGVPPVVPYPLSFIRRFIDTHILDSWQQRWASMISCRQSRIWYPYPDYSLSRKILAYKRKQFSQIVRWTTGHAFLRRQNKLTDPTISSDVCRLCSQVPERADHILLDCEPLAFARADAFRSHFLPRERPLWAPAQLLAYLHSKQLLTIEHPE
jgi:hypothetical protein